MDVQIIQAGVFLGVAIEEELERQLFNFQRRILRDSSNPFEIPEGLFRGFYRLPKEVAMNRINEIEPFLNEPVRTTSIPKHLKVLCALHFYAQGSHQKSVGQDMFFGISQAGVSRCIKDISYILSTHFSRKYITFPRDAEVKLRIIQRLMEKFNFPGIVGCIDCSHIAIVASPTDHPEFPGFAYLNRKGYHSINCQIICDSNLKILSCNARYPGSIHDSAIWNMSHAFAQMEEAYNNNERGVWLLGDSGYPLQPWLLTPIKGAMEGTPESRYTTAHVRVRNTVERCNGVLKSRFRCLLRHRTLHYCPVRAAHIIYSCCVLHNILITNNILVDEENINENNVLEGVMGNVENNDEPHNANLLTLGRQIRSGLVRNYFND